jgi:hypothetical protein
MSALFLRVMHASVPIGFQVGGRAARDKVAGGARFATNVRKDGDAITPVAAQLQDCSAKETQAA